MAREVLITGAASGIGLELAKRFAFAGDNLILLDIDPKIEGIKKDICSFFNVQATSHVVDVSKHKEIFKVKDFLYSKKVDVIINNAGIGYNGEIADMSIIECLKLVEVNLMGPFNVINIFLPDMIREKSGHIVNVSSGQTFFKLPTWGAYAATKAALGVLSEVLTFELKKHNIGVTTVYPFMVNTKFHECTDPNGTLMARLAKKLLPLYSDQPEYLAELIFDAVQSGKKVENVSVLNTVAKLINATTVGYNMLGTITSKFLVK